jgi:predicted RNA-binding protein
MPTDATGTPEPQTWILTGGIENFEIYVERNFDVIGLKERRVRMAERFQPGDEIVFYVTGIKAFGAIALVTSPMFEDREPIWPQGKKKYPEPYPWRVNAEPVVVLEQERFVPAESLLGELQHLKKWPEEHWHLGFQGQLRTVGPEDAALLHERLEAAASVPAAASVKS